MTNLSIVGQDEVGENQVTRSNVAKTQQPDAERLKNLVTFSTAISFLRSCRDHAYRTYSQGWITGQLVKF